MNQTLPLWEILVLKTAKGLWKSPEGGTFKEEMIPVRIRCDEETMNSISRLTLSLYDQKAVLFYKVSDDSHVLYREGLEP